jgi:hypothetical protein
MRKIFRETLVLCSYFQHISGKNSTGFHGCC